MRKLQSAIALSLALSSLSQTVPVMANDGQIIDGQEIQEEAILNQTEDDDFTSTSQDNGQNSQAIENNSDAQEPENPDFFDDINSSEDQDDPAFDERMIRGIPIWKTILITARISPTLIQAFLMDSKESSMGRTIIQIPFLPSKAKHRLPLLTRFLAGKTGSIKTA